MLQRDKKYVFHLRFSNGSECPANDHELSLYSIDEGLC